MEEDLVWIMPFARLRYRLRHGVWCKHTRWHRGANRREDGWWMINCGIRQVRHCKDCDHAEFR